MDSYARKQVTPKSVTPSAKVVQVDLTRKETIRMEVTIDTKRVRWLRWKWVIGTPLSDQPAVGFAFTRAGALKAASLGASTLLSLVKVVESNYVIADLKGDG